MNWGKAIGLLILMILTLPVGGVIWVPLAYFFWKYVKFCVKIDIIVIYLLVRMPIWLFIQAPLYALKISTEKVEAFFVAGLNKLMQSRKTAIFLLTVNAMIGYFLLAPVGGLGSPQLLNLGWWISSISSIAMITVWSVSSTILFLSIKEAISGNIIQGAMPGEWARSELRSSPGDLTHNTAEGIRKTKDTAQQTRGVYNDIKATASDARSLGASDIRSLLVGLADDLGFVEVGAGAGEAAAGTVAAGASTAGVGIGVMLLVLFIALLVFVVQLTFVLGFFMVWLKFVAPMVLGPLTAALGLGSQYGDYIGGEVADNVFAGANVNFEDEMAAVMEARQRVFCLLQGPACLRQWQLNNTKTPDSNNVGETYKLELDRFEVGSGERVDVAYKNGDYKLPISFGLSNTRNGLYGINALNVSYRLRVLDFSRDDFLGGEEDPYCETGWKPVQGYDIRDAEGGGTDYAGNDLYPGTSASTGFMRLDEITLKNCGLLQPGAGETKTVLLEVKYDYYSEATLYFEAMARSVLQQQPDVKIEWKASETADTPVKSVLNVNSPVIFEQENIGTTQRAAVPFDMRASLTTGESDVDYRINNLEIIKSEEVQTYSDSQNCQFRQEGEKLIPSGDAAEIIHDQNEEVSDEEAVQSLKDYVYGGGESSSSTSQSSRWFSDSNPPPFFGCTMELSNPGEITPAGQTLSMDVRANYTVKLDQKLERFRAVNTQCSTMNCPLLITTQAADDMETPRNWKVKCQGPDSSDGCSVVQSDPSDWSQVDLMTGNDLLDSKLENGEYAFDIFRSSAVYRSGDLKEKIQFMPEKGAAIGATERQIDMLLNPRESREGFAVLSVPQESEGFRDSSNPARDIEFVELEAEICDNRKFAEGEERPSKLERYIDRLDEEPGYDPFSRYDTDESEAYIVSFFPRETTCEEYQSSS